MGTVSDFIYGLFGDYGDAGLLICVFLIFLIDALIFPALPEVFFILGYDYNPTPTYGVLLIAMAIAAELIGVFSLYFVVKRIRIPKKIKSLVDRYVGFLVVSDEKILLVNRIAPMIPFAGAFIAMIDSWDPKKCAVYIVIGCIVKYGVILLATGYFYAYFSGPVAFRVTVVFVLAVIAVSLTASYIRKRKSGWDKA
jgi:hypothetical protein